MIEILHEKTQDRREEYEQYLKEHIDGVKRSYNEIKDIALTELNLTDNDISFLEDLINNHDKSKYGEEEWKPYLDYFYPDPVIPSNVVDKNFNYAWLHHIHNNPHHWQYWILKEDEGDIKLLDIPEIYIIEMLCDWHSFSYKNPESTANKWYNDNKDKMLLSDNTKKIIENILKLKPSF